MLTGQFAWSRRTEIKTLPFELRSAHPRNGLFLFTKAESPVKRCDFTVKDVQGVHHGAGGWPAEIHRTEPKHGRRERQGLLQPGVRGAAVAELKKEA
jgi:hypothetical protein